MKKLYIATSLNKTQDINDDILNDEVYTNLNRASTLCRLQNLCKCGVYKVFQLTNKFNVKNKDNQYILVKSSAVIDRIYPKIYNNYAKIENRRDMLNKYIENENDIQYEIYVLKDIQF